MPAPSPAIANHLLSLGGVDGRPLTNMHLQKLVYIAHGWNLAIRGIRLTADDPEAWEYGPVYRDLYNALRRYGSGQVARPIRYSDYMAFGHEDAEVTGGLNNEEILLVDAVWKSYGHFHAFQLSALTHEQGTPWSNAFEHGQNTIISPNEIREHFLRIASERGRETETEPAFA